MGVDEALETETPLTHSDIDDLKEFIKTVVYNGKKIESYIQTRIYLYRLQKDKTSVSLSHNLNSLFKQEKVHSYNGYLATVQQARNK